MSSYRARGSLAAVILAVATLGACAEPDFKTTLRPEGPPEVLAVLVRIEPAPLEVATYCKPDDDKVPGLIPGGQEICPADGVDVVANAHPTAWRIRVVFDELLDTRVEELVDGADPSQPCTDDSVTCLGTLVNTQPFVITCDGEEIVYDGAYDPTGNAFTSPPGPSILAFPVPGTFQAATGADCTVAVRERVVDKDGNSVPENQRALSAYQWSIAPLRVVSTSPAAGASPAMIAADANLVVTFNAPIDIASAEAGDILLTGPDGDTPVAFTVVPHATNANALVVDPTADLAPGEYTFTLPAGADFADVLGGPLTLTETSERVVTFIVPDPA